MGADEAGRLGDRVRVFGDPDADDRVVRLMFDAADAADAEALAEAVLARRDLVGTRVFPRAFGESRAALVRRYPDSPQRTLSPFSLAQRGDP